MGGGIYPVIKEGSALYYFDVPTESFVHLEPEGRPGAQSYSSNCAIFSYDSVNDAAVLFLHRAKEGTPGIYAYLPEANKWETVAEKPPAYDVKAIDPHWSGFYDPVLNVHFLFVGTDGRENGTMWAYRYKRAED
jgi:hypothetical protein